MIDTQNDTEYRAIVLGGTGAVGSAVVRSLLLEPRCTGVTALVRRAVDLFDNVPGSQKLNVVQVDLDNLEAESARLGSQGAVAFCTMGIGQPRKVSEELFWRVDVELPGAFARGVSSAGARHISLLSSVGANEHSRSRYIRAKGCAERAMIDAGMPRTSLFRPSLLVTDEIRYGLQDRITQAVVPLVSPLFPSRYHEIHVRDLGLAMTRNAGRPGSGVETLYYKDFRALLNP